MRYLLLIHGEEAAWNDATEAERRDMYQAYGAVSDQMQERGHLIDAAELQGAATATLVRDRDGEKPGDSQGVNTCVFVHLPCLTSVWRSRKRPSTGAVAVERTRP